MAQLNHLKIGKRDDPGVKFHEMGDMGAYVIRLAHALHLVKVHYPTFPLPHLRVVQSRQISTLSSAVFVRSQ